MSLPDKIPVKYTEEEAGYLSVRPVVRQSFRLSELLDMILGVTGKDVARIQQILRSGTVVYHYYRYWWPGFEADVRELDALLDRFPDSDPARPFRAQECTAVLLVSGGHPQGHSLELSRAEASRRRLIRRRSLWAALMHLAEVTPPVYREYSYPHHADLYDLELSPPQVKRLERDAARSARRGLRVQLGRLPATTRIVFVCHRNE